MMNKQKINKSEKIVFSINLDADLYKRLNTLAEEEERSKNYFIVKALTQFLQAWLYKKQTMKKSNKWMNNYNIVCYFVVQQITEYKTGSLLMGSTQEPV